MAIITWKNIQAPQLTSGQQGLRTASDLIQRALANSQQALESYQAMQDAAKAAETEAADRYIASQMASINDPKKWSEAMTQGKILGPVEQVASLDAMLRANAYQDVLQKRSDTEYASDQIRATDAAKAKIIPDVQRALEIAPNDFPGSLKMLAEIKGVPYDEFLKLGMVARDLVRAETERRALNYNKDKDWVDPEVAEIHSRYVQLGNNPEAKLEFINNEIKKNPQIAYKWILWSHRNFGEDTVDLINTQGNVNRKIDNTFDRVLGQQDASTGSGRSSSSGSGPEGVTGEQDLYLRRDNVKGYRIGSGKDTYYVPENGKLAPTFGQTLAKDPHTPVNVGDSLANLDQLMPGAEAYKDLLVQAMEEFGINTPARMAAFLAQVGHESANFTKMVEERPGNYEGRKDLGNTQPGDGEKFKGRGIIQLTGRENYEKAGKALGLDLVNNPDLAAEPENAFRIAAWYWQNRKLNDLADKGDFAEITRRVGGNNANHPEERETRYRQLKDAFGLNQRKLEIPEWIEEGAKKLFPQYKNLADVPDIPENREKLEKMIWDQKGPEAFGNLARFNSFSSPEAQQILKHLPYETVKPLLKAVQQGELPPNFDEQFQFFDQWFKEDARANLSDHAKALLASEQLNKNGSATDVAIQIAEQIGVTEDSGYIKVKEAIDDILKYAREREIKGVTPAIAGGYLLDSLQAASFIPFSNLTDSLGIIKSKLNNFTANHNAAKIEVNQFRNAEKAYRELQTLRKEYHRRADYAVDQLKQSRVRRGMLGSVLDAFHELDSVSKQIGKHYGRIQKLVDEAESRALKNFEIDVRVKIKEAVSAQETRDRYLKAIEARGDTSPYVRAPILKAKQAQEDFLKLYKEIQGLSGDNPKKAEIVTRLIEEFGLNPEMPYLQMSLEPEVPISGSWTGWYNSHQKKKNNQKKD